MPVYKDGQSIAKDQTREYIAGSGENADLNSKVDELSALTKRLFELMSSGVNLAGNVSAGDIDTSESIEALARAASKLQTDASMNENIGQEVVVKGDDKKTRGTLDLLNNL